MVLGLGGVAARLGSAGASRFAASGGARGLWGSLTSTPLRAGATGAAAGDLLGVSPLSVLGIGGDGGGSGDNPINNLLGGGTIVWAFLGVAVLAVVADLSGDD